MRRIIAFSLFFSASLLVQGQDLKFSAGRALFYHPASDTANTNSAFNLISLDLDRTWTFGGADYSLFSEKGLLMDDETAGGGLGYDMRLGGRYAKQATEQTQLTFTGATRISLNPIYDNDEDVWIMEFAGAGATRWNDLTFLQYNLEFDRLDYAHDPAISGGIYSGSAALSRSFASGRSLRWQLNGSLRNYDQAEEAPLQLGARLQAGQSLWDQGGLSAYAEGGVVVGEASPLGLWSTSAPGTATDPFAYDRIGAGMRFKALFSNSRLAASYDFEFRDFQGSGRTDRIHSAGLEWVNFLGGADGAGRIGLALEPSLRLDQSTADGESYLAVYLMMSITR